MSGFNTDGNGYGVPYQGGMSGEGRTQRQSAPLTWEESTDEFKVHLSHPLWVEAGGTARFYLVAYHKKDGLIGTPTLPFATGPTVSIIDRSGNTVSSGVTMPNGVQQDPANSANFYVQVEFASSLQPGDYAIQWVATYTPQTQSSALPLQFRKGFTVKVTTAPSGFFFKNTKEF